MYYNFPLTKSRGMSETFLAAIRNPLEYRLTVAPVAMAGRELLAPPVNCRTGTDEECYSPFWVSRGISSDGIPLAISAVKIFEGGS